MAERPARAVVLTGLRHAPVTANLGSAQQKPCWRWAFVARPKGLEPLDRVPGGGVLDVERRAELRREHFVVACRSRAGAPNGTVEEHAGHTANQPRPLLPQTPRHRSNHQAAARTPQENLHAPERRRPRGTIAYERDSSNRQTSPPQCIRRRVVRTLPVGRCPPRLRPRR